MHKPTHIACFPILIRCYLFIYLCIYIYILTSHPTHNSIPLGRSAWARVRQRRLPLLGVHLPGRLHRQAALLPGQRVRRGAGGLGLRGLRVPVLVRLGRPRRQGGSRGRVLSAVPSLPEASQREGGGDGGGRAGLECSADCFRVYCRGC